ncbi:MAG: dual specificity protein phosphatase family protein [Gemmataceae bacterium]
MTPVLGGLYLGGREDARDLKVLKQAGVTHVLNCAVELPNYHPGEFAYLRMDMKDPDPRFYRLLGKARTFIDEGRAAGGVLVHCFAGISRSPSTVLAYLAYAERLTLEQAAHRLAASAWTAPDMTFLGQLAENLGEPVDADKLDRVGMILLGRPEG